MSNNIINEYGIYLSAYIVIIDNKIYDVEYLLLQNAISSNNLDEQVTQNVMKILSDDDAKISLNEIYKKLKQTSEEEKKETITLCVYIAFSDNNLDSDELNFLNKSCSEIGVDNDILQTLINLINKNKTSNNSIQISKKLHGKGFYKFLASVTSGSFQQKMKDRYNKCLLSGEDYSNAVNEMKVIADEDLDNARKSLEKISESLENLCKEMETNTNNLKKATGKLVENKKAQEDENVVIYLNNMKKQIQEFAYEGRQTAEITLKKKKAALSNYTISFMGRTKAGKSTLHSVILGGINKEFIGVGKERTTRYNRVYQWNGIRIIDTPGIGAPGGKKDTEIAADIIDETDLICYVVTSDSVQETEFDFLQGIREHNTPVIVLLNKKENILQPDFKRERFLRNPNQWYTTQDKDSLEGSIRRIREYADKYYKNSYFEIFPVQLLAAQQSLIETNKIDKKKFYEGSHLETFLDAIRIQILQEGKLKRSKTMLDGSLYILYKYKKDFENRVNALSKFENEFKEKREKSFVQIESQGQKIKDSLERGLTEEFDTFIQNDLQRFAQDNYDVKKDALEYQWKEFMQSSGFENRLKDRFQNEVEEYKNSIESVINQLTENMEFAIGNISSSSFGFDLGNLFDSRTFTSILGSTIGVAGAIVTFILGASNPIGWVITGVGVIVCLFSNIFKSKKEKIRLATEKLYESISSSVRENQKKTISDMVKQFSKMHNNVLDSLRDVFDKIDEGLENLLSKLSCTVKIINIEIDKLNKLYAVRIINYSTGSTVYEINDDKAFADLRVDRLFGESMKITTSQKLNIDTTKLSHELQETISTEVLQ